MTQNQQNDPTVSLVNIYYSSRKKLNTLKNVYTVLYSDNKSFEDLFIFIHTYTAVENIMGAPKMLNYFFVHHKILANIAILDFSLLLPI